MPTLAIGFVLLECKQPAPLRPQFVYVANFYSNLVSAYSIGSNGALTPVPGSPFGEDAAVGPVSVAVDPTAKFAYEANFASNNISAFSIGSNGSYTPPGIALRRGPNSFFNSSGAHGQVRLRGKQVWQQHLGLQHRFQRGADTRLRFTLCRGIRTLFSGSGPHS